MAKVLNSKILQDKIIGDLSKEVRSFKIKPVLAIIQIGNVRESDTYIRRKNIFAHKIGVKVVHIKFDMNVTEKEVLETIKRLDGDALVHGVIVQLPIPKHLDEFKILESISPQKDVDGFTSTNFKLLAAGSTDGLMNATTKGVIDLLDHYQINLVGKHVLVIGKSVSVGKPTALALLNRNATVTIGHLKTVGLKELAQSADILVVAIGQPRFIDKRYVHAGQVIIDIGINYDAHGKLVGDVDFDSVKDIVKAISPVPGGVGAMTVASLFKNLISAYKRQEK